MMSRDHERSNSCTPVRLERNISKMARDRDSVPKDHQLGWPMDYQMVT